VIEAAKTALAILFAVFTSAVIIMYATKGDVD
jgi:hypothetical protein